MFSVNQERLRVSVTLDHSGSAGVASKKAESSGRLPVF